MSVFSRFFLMVCILSASAACMDSAPSSDDVETPVAPAPTVAPPAAESLHDTASGTVAAADTDAQAVTCLTQAELQALLASYEPPVVAQAKALLTQIESVSEPRHMQQIARGFMEQLDEDQSGRLSVPELNTNEALRHAFLMLPPRPEFENMDVSSASFTVSQTALERAMVFYFEA